MPTTPSDPKPNRSGGPNGWLGIVLMGLVLAGFVSLSTFHGPGPTVQVIPYSEIKQIIRSGRVSAAVLEQHTITVIADKTRSGAAQRYRAVTPSQGDTELLSLLESKGIQVTARKPQGFSILTYILPWILILAVYLWLQRRMLGGIGGGMSTRDLGDLFSGRFSKPSKLNKRITFDDVAGQDQAKREVAELVEFLRDPERFHRVGAEVPHGVLLMGPPGTGKTLLAKALAGEADVPYFSMSGSEFIEVFVGVGAGRVRRVFEAARKAAPSIIFIDELDSIGRTRGAGLGGGHDEREQTLNQILAELDGFGGKEAVVVLAATNRPDVLDPALLRPGRFDRHVTLNLPDKRARRAILDIHARNLPLVNASDLDTIAEGTPGFSGADLKNLLNEAAIGAARKHCTVISEEDLHEARDKVLMGTVRTLAIQPEERHRLAVHEAGHTAGAYFMPGADPLYKVTIIPRGSSLGGTHMLSKEERHTFSEDDLRAQLVMLMAGRAAEKLLIGSVSSGADDDIRRATQLARSMVSRWGMDDEVGPVDLRRSEDNPFLGQSMAQPAAHADETAAQVDRAVIDLLKKSEQQATEIIIKHKEEVQYLVHELEEKEVLDLDQIRNCLEAHGKITSLDRRRHSGEPRPTSK